MQHADPYHLPDSGESRENPPGGNSGEVQRTLLWVLLVISMVGNVVASFIGASVIVHLVCGAVTLLCGGTLVVRRLRGRR